MMRVRQRVWSAFRQHLGKFFPAACAALGEEQVRRVVRYGIERAASHGVTRERGVCAWVDLMFTFGRDFDRDPDLPWASEGNGLL